MHFTRFWLRWVALAIAIAAAFAVACAGPSVTPPAVSIAPPPPARIPSVVPVAAALTGPDESSIDRSVAPCDDFYQFACGGWMKATPIPEDEASWVRSFSVIHEQNQKGLRVILERDALGDSKGDPYGLALGDFWATCMDEGAVEKRGLDELTPELKSIEGVHDEKSLVEEIARLHRIGVGAAFGFDSEIDFKDASQMIAGMSQGGLGLPERDYYFRDDPRTKGIRAEYAAHVERTLQLAGEAQKQAQADAKSVLKLETELARVSMTNTELRDPQKIYHRIDLGGLKRLAPEVPWQSYLDALGFPSITAINVGQPEFVRKLGVLAKAGPMADWRAYLRFHLTRTASPFLAQKFVDEWFHFRQVLTGTKRLQPRWKRCVRFVDQMMGEALAQPFVKDALGDDGKRAAEQMVAGIEVSMKADIDSLAWMDEPTRTRAEIKLTKIVNKIGFPSKWRTYDGLAIDRSSFVGNVERALAFELARRLAKVGKPVDKEEWEMTPPTVNAYYEPTRNEMVFPAGILQAPFYGKLQAAPMNFGAIGMVVGHELTHGFDDEGRQFDENGNLRDWWSAPVAREFDDRASCVEKQFDGYVVVDDAHIKGKLTLGENIADLGGVKLAHAAFQRFQKEQTVTPNRGGFTPDQEFFMGFAQSWCANYRPESLRLLVATNPHSPPKFRVNGPLSNVREFANAFSCKDGAPMVRSSETRCEIW